METILIKAFQLILSLSILVIVHELGHFLFAKLFKVRVEKFYLFFNPWFTLFKFKPKGSETEYGIGWLPLGGYVKISGMIDESMDKEAMAEPPKPWEFRTKPAWQRLLIMVGGVLMNFILAFVIYAMIVFTWGEEHLPLRNVTMGLSYNQATLDVGFQNGDIPVSADGKQLEELNMDVLYSVFEAKEVEVLRNGEIVKITLPEGFKKVLLDKEPNFVLRYPFVIDQVLNGSPAQDAGLKEGDDIVGVYGEDMVADQLRATFADNKETEITINVKRGGETIELNITPDESGKIGVMPRHPYSIYETVKTKYNFFASFPAGIRIGIQQIKDYLGQFKYIFTKEGAQSLGGFGAIGNLFPEKWNWGLFWERTAFLSIILGVMNLLPIPALDGGHVMFLLYEVISGRKPNDKFMEYAQMVGMFLLFALLIYANGMDIVRAFFK
ncbi:regulator of sigma E protease [Dysgonomonadaceae bacterium PH5-43]|nr:regulator of sigma E protease [Dysgonomonadaceae bacterium PH5-43]